MRPAHLLPFAPLLAQAAPPALPIEEAVAQILEAFDEAPTGQKLPLPSVQGDDRPERDWLLAALREDRPKNPFPKGSPNHREAESIRALLAGAPGERPARLAALSLRLAGSQAALWRWGQALARRGELPRELRRAWEDRLVPRGGALVIRGWALRHALCFALAEGDESRFASLREACGEEIPDLFQPFQRAFALLGGPLPRIYLWSLPGLEALDLPLARLGSRLYIAPLEADSAPAPAGSAWIIPCTRSNLPAQVSLLEGASLEEGRQLAAQLRAMARTAYFAPTREPFEACALAYFPIDIRLDAKGFVRSIRMGDAALARE